MATNNLNVWVTSPSASDLFNSRELNTNQSGLKFETGDYLKSKVFNTILRETSLVTKAIGDFVKDKMSSDIGVTASTSGGTTPTQIKTALTDTINSMIAAASGFSEQTVALTGAVTGTSSYANKTWTVTTSIPNKSIGASKLDNIVGTGSATAGGLTVSLSHDTSTNKLNIGLTGTVTASHAATADNATYATSAGSATNATYAATAGSAGTATSAGTANTATNAVNATNAGTINKYLHHFTCNVLRVVDHQPQTRGCVTFTFVDDMEEAIETIGDFRAHLAENISTLQVNGFFYEGSENNPHGIVPVAASYVDGQSLDDSYIQLQGVYSNTEDFTHVTDAVSLYFVGDEESKMYTNSVVCIDTPYKL